MFGQKTYAKLHISLKSVLRIAPRSGKTREACHAKQHMPLGVSTERNVFIEKQCTARCLQRVAPRKWEPKIRSFNEYKPLKFSEPHVASNVRYIARQ